MRVYVEQTMFNIPAYVAIVLKVFAQCVWWLAPKRVVVVVAVSSDTNGRPDVKLGKLWW